MAGNFGSDLLLDAWETSYVNSVPASWHSGVAVEEEMRGDLRIQRMEIQSDDAANALCKPIGQYFTLQFPKIQRRFHAEFETGALAIAEAVSELLGFEDIAHSGKSSGKADKSVLIACLGNPAVTPDALGPLCAHHLLVTRHLKSAEPESFAPFATVALLAPGVLGSTGIESAALIGAAVRAVQPDAVIAIDALAARTVHRLCNTIQLCDTGLAPGAGIGNHRQLLNSETLGVPVLGIGIPTVVGAATLIADLAGECGDSVAADCSSFFVAPREIDTLVADGAKLLAYGINLALHPQLTLEDFDLLLG